MNGFVVGHYEKKIIITEETKRLMANDWLKVVGAEILYIPTHSKKYLLSAPRIPEYMSGDTVDECLQQYKEKQKKIIEDEKDTLWRIEKTIERIGRTNDKNSKTR